MINPNDPHGLVAQQQQSAFQQQAMSDDYIKQILKNSQSRSADMTAAMYYPDSPKLKFDTNATGIGTGIVQGLGNAVNNYQQLKNYRTRTEMLNNAVLEQRNKEKQQVDMLAQQEAAKQAETNRQDTETLDILQKNYPKLVDLYKAGSREQRGEIYKVASGLMATPLQEGVKSEAQIQSEQDKLNWQRERFQALTGVFPEQVFAQGNQGALTPQVQSAWRYVYDSDPPKDALDFKKRFAETGSSVESYKGAAIDNQTRGEQNQADLDGKLTSNYIAGVDAKYAEKLKEIDVLKGQGEAQKAKDMEKNLGDGRLRFDQLMSIYDTLTPGEIKQYNAIFKSQSVDSVFQLPEKDDPNMKPLKNKKGAITGFVDNSGYQYNPDRTLKE